MDLAATKIAYVDGDPKNGALVTVEARDKLVMPVTLRVVFADGSKKDMRLPAETWIRQAATAVPVGGISKIVRSEEHTSELQSLMRISYAVFCLKKKTTT